MLPIFIPTLGRAERLRWGPLECLPHDATAYLVVEEHEYEDYKRTLQDYLRSPEHPRCSVVLHNLGVSGGGIANTRLCIGKFADAAGYSAFMMMDDDIKILCRSGVSDWRLKGSTPEQTSHMLRVVESLLHTHSHVGVSAREGNNRIGVGRPDVLFDVNTRTMRCVAWRTKDFLAQEHCRVPVMEDFDVSIQALRLGLSNACVYYWAQGQSYTNAPGGCATFRTLELHNAAAEYLHELHPEFTKLRDKENKTTSGGLGKRKEVTVYWKKAAASGRAKKGDN